MKVINIITISRLISFFVIRIYPELSEKSKNLVKVMTIVLAGVLITATVEIATAKNVPSPEIANHYTIAEEVVTSEETFFDPCYQVAGPENNPAPIIINPEDFISFESSTENLDPCRRGF